MNNPTPKIKNPAAIKAIILVFIGVFGSLALKFFTIIGEASLITLFGLTVFVGVIMYFKDSIIDFSLGLSGVKVKLKAIDAIIAKETEPPKSRSMRVEAFGTDDDTKAVISALGSTKYTWRYPASVARDTNLPIDLINDKINWLIINNLATEAKGIDGKIYGLSTKGRALFIAIDKSA